MEQHIFALLGMAAIIGAPIFRATTNRLAERCTIGGIKASLKVTPKGGTRAKLSTRALKKRWWALIAIKISNAKRFLNCARIGI